MGWPVVARSDSPAATKEFAARLAGLCVAGDVILLIGDLGAGKTAFAQGFAAALGVEGPVTSPTFALVRQYRCGDDAVVETLIHADVYRTGTIGEVVELALAELVEERAIALVEWGDMAAPAFGEDALEVTLALSDPDPDPDADAEADADGSAEERIISLTGRGRWLDRAGDVGRALAAPSARVAP
jgi:tRNA threonylcarbamoyladenosine biosynthesis protein TsaE